MILLALMKSDRQNHETASDHYQKMIGVSSSGPNLQSSRLLALAATCPSSKQGSIPDPLSVHPDLRQGLSY